MCQRLRKDFDATLNFIELSRQLHKVGPVISPMFKKRKERELR